MALLPFQLKLRLKPAPEILQGIGLGTETVNIKVILKAIRGSTRVYTLNPKP